LLEQPGPHRSRQTALIYRGRALGLLGRFEDAAATFRELRTIVTDDYFGAGEGLEAEAQLALLNGMPRRAIELADAALAVPAPVPGIHVVPRILRAWACLELGRDTGPVESAPQRSLAGAEPELTGIRHLARTQGDARRRDGASADAAMAAALAFREAAALWQGFDAPRELFSRWAYGEALRRAGQIEEATELLQMTLDAALARGFEPLAARLRRSLRLAGVRRATARQRSSLQPLALTTRELELVDLVELGLTNIEIARRLGLGRPTVARLLASAMSKLGVERRAQLAGAARTSHR